MTLRDAEGEITVRLGDQFRCKLGPGPAALCQVLLPVLPLVGDVCLVSVRILDGELYGPWENAATGETIERLGPRACVDLPADRVAAAVRRYRNAHSTKPQPATAALHPVLDGAEAADQILKRRSEEVAS